MKKTKLLMPILATAGVGCAIAPMITLVGCSTNLTMTYDQTNECYKSEIRDWKKGTYILTFNYKANQFKTTNLRIGFFDANNNSCSVLVDGNPITLEISGNSKTLIREETHRDFCYNQFAFGFDMTFKITWKNPKSAGTLTNACIKVWTEPNA